MHDLFILAGEPSGDLQGAHLLEALYSRKPNLHIAGVAGPRMRAFPIECRTRMEELQVMGFTDVVRALPRIWRLFRQIRSEILRLQPKTVVCIDYPGFNIRLERSLRRHGYRGRLIHYICPTIWAWGKGRIPIMAQNLDLLLTIFPFEKNCFSQTTLQVEYVGHPLVKKILQHRSFEHFKERYHLDNTKKILAIFPGSRKTQIERNFPIQLQTARRLQDSHKDIQIAISLAHPDLESFLTIPNTRLIHPDHHYDLMQHSFLALATSGTVTLELALFQTPTIVNYAINPFDVFLAQKIFRINLPHYAMVNILGGKTIFPELFGPDLTIDSLWGKASEFWDQPDMRGQCQFECARVRDMLGNSDAAEKAAEMILLLS
jgi:lipid-A-disaccharide synthase